MKIGITSQNFRTITSHAGKCRRFIIFTAEQGQAIEETDRLDLPLEMSLHAWNGEGRHPLFDLDALITGGCGEGFIRRMAREGVEVKTTSETDPVAAVEALLDGTLPQGSSATQIIDPP